MASPKTPRGKVPTSRSTSPEVARPEPDADLAAEWNELPKRHRKGIRRLTRLGRPQVDAHDAELAIRFATFQRTRGWYRYFWLWFVPLMLGGLTAGAALHPVVIGMVLAAGFTALWARRGYRLVEQINGPVLVGDGGTPAAV
jgi:hypothetical protein